MLYKLDIKDSKQRITVKFNFITTYIEKDPSCFGYFILSI